MLTSSTSAQGSEACYSVCDEAGDSCSDDCSSEHEDRSDACVDIESKPCLDNSLEIALECQDSCWDERVYCEKDCDESVSESAPTPTPHEDEDASTPTARSGTPRPPVCEISLQLILGVGMWLMFLLAV